MLAPSLLPSLAQRAQKGEGSYCWTLCYHHAWHLKLCATPLIILLFVAVCARIFSGLVAVLCEIPATSPGDPISLKKARKQKYFKKKRQRRRLLNSNCQRTTVAQSIIHSSYLGSPWQSLRFDIMSAPSKFWDFSCPRPFFVWMLLFPFVSVYHSSSSSSSSSQRGYALQLPLHPLHGIRK